MPPALVIEETTLRAGSLDYQCRLYYPERSAPRGVMAFAPPHPYLGGNFDNNVVVRIAEEAAAAGDVVLTYNLPGVGRTPPRSGSETARESFWDDPKIGAEADLDAKDFLVLCDALARIAGAPPEAVHGVGYSYGAAVALLAAKKRRFASLTLISAPLPRMRPGVSDRLRRPGLFIFAEDDLALEGAKAEDLLSTRPPACGLRRICGADHFYIDHLDALAGIVLTYIHEASVR